MAMLALILPVHDEIGFDNIRQTLSNVLPDVFGEISVLVLATEKTYLTCRDYFQKGITGFDAECLVDCLKKGEDPIRVAMDRLNLSKIDYVYIANDNVIAPIGTVAKLIRAYNFWPHAGFISAMPGNGKYYRYDDIYEENPQKILMGDTDTGGELTEVDTVQMEGMLTKPVNLITAYGVLDTDYGLTLRRAGYKNYIEKSIKLKVK